MAMKVIWRQNADQDIKGIYDYLFEVAGERTAQRIVDRLVDAVELLLSMPQMGSLEPLLDDMPQGYRSVVAHPNYKVVYWINGDTIVIEDIWDCRQSPMGLFKRLFGG